MPRNPLAPERILELGCRSPHVQHCLTEWRMGNVTWEQALTMMVLALHQVVDNLMEEMERQDLWVPRVLTLEQAEENMKRIIRELS